jgi:aryl-alcohol dehydrogenase-like predicted oxidoreductase
MERRKLGNQGLEASAQGLGCMGMSIAYGATDDEESIATIHRARELGVDFLDTAEMYGPHHNEELVGRAIAGRRDDFFIATKFGLRRDFKTLEMERDASPEAVRTSIEGSLKRLGTDHVDLYQLHRVDPETPIEETVGALGELVEQGKVRGIGLSEAAPDTIRRAHETFPLSSVQTEYSLWTREDDVLETCRELGIGFIAYSPLGRGFLTGKIRNLDELAEDDFRRSVPRFQGENLERNVAIVDLIERLAAERKVTPGQLALAWVHSRGEDVFPIPGTKRRSYLEENVAAFEVELSEGELRELDAAGDQVAGDRYDPTGMSGVRA